MFSQNRVHRFVIGGLVVLGLLGLFCVDHLLISKSEASPAQQNSSCVFQDKLAVDQGDNPFDQQGTLSDDQWCVYWEFNGRGGDTIDVTLRRISGDGVPILSVYVRPTRTPNQAILLSRAVDLNPLDPGAIERQIHLENVLTSGTYVIQIEREGGPEQSQTSTGKSNSGAFQLTGNVSRRGHIASTNLVELQGAMPLANGGGMLTCSSQPSTHMFNHGLPTALQLTASISSEQVQIRDIGDRWTFYAQQGTTYTFDLAITDARTDLRPNDNLSGFYAPVLELWYGSDLPAHPNAEDNLYGRPLSYSYTIPRTGFYTLVVSTRLESPEELQSDPDYEELAARLPAITDPVNVTYSIACDPATAPDAAIGANIQAQTAPEYLESIGVGNRSTAEFDQATGLMHYQIVTQHDTLELVTEASAFQGTTYLSNNSPPQQEYSFTTYSLKVRTEPYLIDRLMVLENYIILELADGGTFITRFEDDSTRSILDVRRITASGQHPIRIETLSGSMFVSDWRYPQTVWAIERTFFVQIDPNQLPTGAADPGGQWLVAVPRTLQMMTVDGLSSISLFSEDTQPTQQLKTDWIGIQEITYQTNSTFQMVFREDKQFITNILDVITVTENDQVQHIEFSADKRSIITSLENIETLSLVNDSILIDFIDPQIADISEALAYGQSQARSENEIVSFVQERIGGTRTNNYIIERRSGTRELLLEIGQHIVAPSPQVLTLDPGLAIGSPLSSSPGTLSVPVPQGMNNIGTEFCDECDTAGPYWGLVNPANGNLFYSVTDFNIPGPGLDLDLTRNYNSLYPQAETRWPRQIADRQFFYGLQESWITSFGPGWTSDVDVFLDVSGALFGNINPELSHTTDIGFVVLKTASGSQHFFYRDDKNANLTTSPEKDASCNDFNIPYYSDTALGWQVQQCFNSWRLLRDDNLIYHFDRTGRLTRIAHTNGYQIGLYWERMSLDEQTAFLDQYQWGNSEVKPTYRRIMQTPYYAQLVLYYGYYDSSLPDTLNNLRVLAAVAPDGARTQYHYNATGGLEEVLYADGRTAFYTYEPGSYRLSRHRDPYAPYLPYLEYTYTQDRIGLVYAFDPDNLDAPREKLYEYSYDQFDGAPNGKVYTKVEDVQRDRTTQYVFASTTGSDRYRLNQRRDEARDLEGDEFQTTTFTREPLYLPFGRTFTPNNTGLPALDTILDPEIAAIPRLTASTLQFQTDEQGHLTQINEIYGAANTTLSYDAFGRLKNFGDGVNSANTWFYTYDPVHGMLSEIVDSAGNKHTFCYSSIQGRDQRSTTANLRTRRDVDGFVTLYRVSWHIGPYAPDVVPQGTDLCAAIQSTAETPYQGSPPPAEFRYPVPVTSFIYQAAGSSEPETPYVTQLIQWLYDQNTGTYTPVPSEIERDTMGRMMAVHSLSNTRTYTWGDQGTGDYNRVVRVQFGESDDPQADYRCYQYTEGNTLLTDNLGWLESVTDSSGQRIVYQYYDYTRLHRVRSIATYQNTSCDAETPDPANRLKAERYDYMACHVIDKGDYTSCSNEALVGIRVKDLYVRVEEIIGPRDDLPLNDVQRYTVYHYDQDNNLIQIIEKRRSDEDLTRVTCYDYDTVGNLQAYGDHLPDCDFIAEGRLPNNGHFYTFAYNANYQLTRIQDKMDGGRSWRLEYTAQQRGPSNYRLPLRVIDPLNNTTEYTYDALDNVVGLRELQGGNARELRSTTFAYNADGNPTRVSINNGPQTFYCYDTLNRLVEVRDVACNDIQGRALESFEYDLAGNVRAWTQHVFADGQTVDITYQFEYDTYNRLTSITDPESNQRWFGYNPSGDLVFETDWNGIVTTYHAAYKTDARVPGQIVWVCPRYDVSPYNGDLQTITDLLATSCENDGSGIQYQYDARGLLLNTNAFGYTRTIDYTYDEWDRIDTQITRTGATFGAVTREDLVFTYDEFDELVSVTNSLGDTYSFSYDRHGNLVQVRDANGYTRRYEYDANNNLIVYQDRPDGSTLRTIDFYYDGLNRLDCLVYRGPDHGSDRQLTPCNGTRIEANLTDFAYDAASNITEIVQMGASGDVQYDERLRTTYTYYDFNQLAAVTVEDLNDRTVNGWQYTYTVDQQGPVVRATPPDGVAATVTYQYDRLNQLDTITVNDVGQSYQLQAWYDGNGALCGYQIVSGPTSELPALHPYDRGTSAQCQPQSPAMALSASNVFNFYTYWPGGTLRSAASTPDQAVTYSYDALGNLAHVDSAQGDSTYYQRLNTADGEELFIFDPITAQGCEGIYQPVGTKDYADDVREYLFADLSWVDTCRITHQAYDTSSLLTQLGYVIPVSDTQPLVALPEYRFQYDPQGNLARITDPEGHALIWAYDGADNAVRFEDRIGASIQATYDVLHPNRLRTLTNRLGEQIQFNYDSLGRVTAISSVVNTQPVQYGFQIDGLNYLNSVLLPAPGTQTGTRQRGSDYTIWFENNSAGLPTQRYPGGSNTPIQYSYNTLQQLNNVTYPEGTHYTYTYDLLGNVTRVAQSEEFYWEYQWLYRLDQRGNLTALPGQITEKLGANENQIAITYDDAGHRTCMQVIENGATTQTIRYQYNLDGNPVWMGLASSCQDENRGDMLVEITWQYRPDGQIAEIRRVSRSNGGGGSEVCTTYDYDSFGNLVSMTHKDCQPAGTQYASYSYEAYTANGDPKRITETHGADTRTILDSYDAMGRVTDERWIGDDDQLLYAMSISYDKTRSRQTVTVNGESRTYCYDPQTHQLMGITPELTCNTILSQPLTCSQSAVQRSESSTPPVALAILAPLSILVIVGRKRLNLWRIVVLSGIAAIIVLAVPPTTQAQSLLTRFAYDTNGRMCAREEIFSTESSRMRLYYDSENRLSSVNRDGNPIDMQYTASGQLRSVEAQVSTTFLYDQEQLLRVRDSEQTIYYFGVPEQAVPLFSIVRKSTDSTPEYRWILPDGSNSVRRLITTSGDAINAEPFDYNAFGEPVSQNLDFHGVRYQGMFWELFAEHPAYSIGFYTIGARAYDPSIGMFLQPDPLGPDPSGQLYSYHPNQSLGSAPSLDLPDYPSSTPSVPPTVSLQMLNSDLPLPPDMASISAPATEQRHLMLSKLDMVRDIGLYWTNGGVRWRGITPQLYVGHLQAGGVADYAEDYLAAHPNNPFLPLTLLESQDPARIAQLSGNSSPDRELTLSTLLATPFIWPSPPVWGENTQNLGERTYRLPDERDLQPLSYVPTLFDQIERHPNWQVWSQMFLALDAETPGDMLGIAPELYDVLLPLGRDARAIWFRERTGNIPLVQTDTTLADLRESQRYLLSYNSLFQTP